MVQHFMLDIAATPSISTTPVRTTIYHARAWNILSLSHGLKVGVVLIVFRLKRLPCDMGRLRVYSGVVLAFCVDL